MPTLTESIITLLTIFTTLLIFSFLINLAFNLKQNKVRYFSKGVKKRTKPTIPLKATVVSREQIKVKEINKISR